MDLQQWQHMWDSSTRPYHAQDSEAFYEGFAREVRAVLPGPFDSTLDIGCGNGALYPYLKEYFGSYTGVDYSDAMLSDFREHHPELQLSRSDGSAYRDDKQYALIFSNGVLQNFDDAMVSRFLGNIRQMMTEDSACFLGMMPDRRLRHLYARDYLKHDTKDRGLVRTWARQFLYFVRGQDGIGTWFDVCRFGDLCGQHGFETTIHGSIAYRYRFHAVLRLHSRTSQT